jgi:hypothetical protein
MSEAVAETEPEAQLQYRTLTRQGAIFHGHGGDESGEIERESQFLTACDRAVSALLRGAKTPLFLSCVDVHFGPYQRLNTYPHLMNAAISGNPGLVNEQEILRQCSAFLEHRFLESQRDAAELYRTSKASGTASDKLPEVVRAAVDGRVDTIWIPKGRQVMGVWQPDHHDIQLQATDGSTYDLLDFGGVHTFLTGGRVFVVPPDRMPDHGPIAAMFRY